VEHHVGLTHDDVRSIIREELAAAVPAAEPITAEHAQDVGEAAAESAVEAIVEAAQEAEQEAELGPEDVELPGDVPEQAEGAVEDVGDVIDQVTDEAPRRRHWMHRSIIGGR